MLSRVSRPEPVKVCYPASWKEDWIGLAYVCLQALIEEHTEASCGGLKKSAQAVHVLQTRPAVIRSPART